MVNKQDLDTVIRRLFTLRAPKVLITIVLLLSWTDFYQGKDHIQVIDAFAGAARIARSARRCGRVAVALDVDYSTNSRVFDVNTSPGFVLSLLAVLEGRFEELWAALGVCCSSWIVTSRGSTGRSWMLPMGNWAYAKVASANCMVTRTVCMILLMFAVGAVWFLEQPHSSLMPRHTRFQWLVRVLEDLGLKVYYQSFWMKWFRHPTPKRTTVYSSSPLIKELDMGPLTRNHLTPEVQTTDRYQNGSGKARFKGNKNLKGTQLYTWKYAAKIVDLGFKSVHQERDPIPNVDFTTPLTELYEKYEWGDLWSEGHLIDVVRYLRGSKRLTIPEEWRPLLPTELVDEPMD
mmetsp:Transcript_40679/g.63947  ORF Transcript_40679/g.63947 Transcript_40679/m.63947 type:complete len:346 (-) Transcript_40679:30-1067(-)